MSDQGLDPKRNHRRISPIGILAAAENIKITESDGLHAVKVREHVGIQFIDEFRNGIRRKRTTNVMLHFGQFLAIAVCGRARRIDKSLHPFVPGGDEHVQETIDIGAVCRNRIVDAARDTPQCSLLQYGRTTFNGLPASRQISDIAFDKMEINAFKQRFDITHEPSGQVVQTSHIISFAHEILAKIGTDEPGASGDKD